MEEVVHSMVIDGPTGEQHQGHVSEELLPADRPSAPSFHTGASEVTSDVKHNRNLSDMRRALQTSVLADLDELQRKLTATRAQTCSPIPDQTIQESPADRLKDSLRESPLTFAPTEQVSQGNFMGADVSPAYKQSITSHQAQTPVHPLSSLLPLPQNPQSHIASPITLSDSNTGNFESLDTHPAPEITMTDVDKQPSNPATFSALIEPNQRAFTVEKSNETTNIAMKDDSGAGSSVGAAIYSNGSLLEGANGSSRHLVATEPLSNLPATHIATGQSVLSAKPIADADVDMEDVDSPAAELIDAAQPVPSVEEHGKGKFPPATPRPCAQRTVVIDTIEEFHNISDGPKEGTSQNGNVEEAPRPLFTKWKGNPTPDPTFVPKSPTVSPITPPTIHSGKVSPGIEHRETAATPVNINPAVQPIPGLVIPPGANIADILLNIGRSIGYPGFISSPGAPLGSDNRHHNGNDPSLTQPQDSSSASITEEQPSMNPEEDKNSEASSDPFNVSWQDIIQARDPGFPTYPSNPSTPRKNLKFDDSDGILEDNGHGTMSERSEIPEPFYSRSPSTPGKHFDWDWAAKEDAMWAEQEKHRREEHDDAVVDEGGSVTMQDANEKEGSFLTSDLGSVSTPKLLNAEGPTMSDDTGTISC